MLSLWILCVLGAKYLIPAFAQFGPDPHWLSPNGSHPDFTYAYTVGSTIDERWKALNASTNDLWLTSYDNGNDSFAKLLKKNIDINNPGSYEWLIKVADKPVDTDDRFVLRFVPAGVAFYQLLFNVESSPGFYLRLPAAASATTSSSQTQTSATATSATSSAASASATTASQANSFSGGLSTGAKAGIGVGVGVGVIALLVIGYLFGVRYRKRREQRSAGHDYTDTKPESAALVGSGEHDQAGEPRPAELKGQQIHPAELEGQNGGRGMVELDSRAIGNG